VSVRVEAEVLADPLEAFEALTEALRDSELALEPHAAGASTHGEIVVWQPGRRLEAVLDETSAIAATFEPVGEATRIVVELDDAAEGYERLWRALLDGVEARYQRKA
jgi:hypothetical protein